MNEEANELQEKVMQLENFVRPYLKGDASTRYNALKMGHPAYSLQVLTFLAKAIQMGQIVEPLNDNQFRSILNQLQKTNVQFNIRR